jgi:hypothetical protein
VLLGNGDGTFQSAVSYSTGAWAPDSVVIADVNGKGYPDLVLANTCQAYGCANGEVSVLVGNGSGKFPAAVTYNSGGQDLYRSSIAVGDLTGNGYPDVIAANETSASVGVLLNDAGVFQPAVTYAPGGAPPRGR